MEVRDILGFNRVEDSDRSSLCVVMFSGGRDSTLAALRIQQLGLTPILVTVTSNHLVGIEAVKKRLKELDPILPASTRWLHVQQPTALYSDQSFYSRTCLPCQQAYVVVAAKVAQVVGCKQIAMGYAAYQGDWPEQTRLATERLYRVLAKNGIQLLLPVYQVETKDSAIAELRNYGLSTTALEQKCLRQVTNVALDQPLLESQVDGWEKAISASLRRLTDIELEIFADLQLKDI